MPSPCSSTALMRPQKGQRTNSLFSGSISGVGGSRTLYWLGATCALPRQFAMQPHKCPGWESNPQTVGSRPTRFACLRTWT